MMIELALVASLAQVTEAYPGETIDELQNIDATLGTISSKLGSAGQLMSHLNVVQSSTSSMNSILSYWNSYSGIHNDGDPGTNEGWMYDVDHIADKMGNIQTSIGQILTNVSDYITPSVTAIETAITGIGTSVGDIHNDTSELVENTDEVEGYLTDIETHTSNLSSILAQLTTQTSLIQNELILIATYGSGILANTNNMAYQVQAIDDTLTGWETDYIQDLYTLFNGDGETQGDLYERVTAILDLQFDQFQTDTLTMQNDIRAATMSIDSAISELEIDLDSIRDDIAAIRPDVASILSAVESMTQGGATTTGTTVEDELTDPGHIGPLLTDTHTRVSVYESGEVTFSAQIDNELAEVSLLDSFSLPYQTEAGSPAIPVWTITVPLSTLGSVFPTSGVTDTDVSIDWSFYDGWLRTTVHAVVIFFASIKAGLYLWEEVRRYG